MRENQQRVRKTQNNGPDTQEFVLADGHARALKAQGLHAVGWVHARAGYEYVFADPPLGLLFACLEGGGEVLVRGRWRPCGPGTAYLAPAQVLRGYRHSGAGEWLCVWALAHRPSLIGASEPALTPADGGLLWQAIRGMYEEWRGPGDADMLENYARIVSVHVRRLARPTLGARGRLRNVWDQVLADLAHPWSVAELAGQACLTEEGFRLLCRRETGHSPMEYVTLLRIRHAGFLLLTDSLSVAEVAEAVGYGNPRAFSTAFRRVQGVPPSEHRSGTCRT